MREWSQMLLEFVWRAACRDKMHFIKVETAISGSSHGEMAVVYGVKRTAEERDAARMMFCSGALRLRGGQCASPRVSRCIFS